MGRFANGFTLLELLLALALSVIFVGLLGTAFSFYATKLDARNMEVRRSMLAYSIVNMITDDLRAALYPPEFDPTSLENTLSMGSGGGGAPPGQGEDLSAAGLADDSDSTIGDDPLAAGSGTVEPVETADLSAGNAISSRPGLLGNQSQIQFEVSRLPRIEEYQQMLAAQEPGALTDIPSDIKTISYYVQGAGGQVRDPLQVDGLGNPNSGTSGLVRRSLDRAITKWSLENGAMNNLMASGDLIAPEVVSLQFRYWDGLQWQLFWDSDQNGSLPLAIELTLTMRVQPADPNDPTGTELTRQYVHVIRLPSGRPMEQDTGDLSAVGL
jgi:prepilin-type N-terminal cleavage/methylation domain-containing protein